MNTINQYHPVPQPDDIPLKDKEDAMGAYLMMFAAIGAGLPLPLINLLASIIYYNIFKKSSLFVRFHCHQALYSQLPLTLMNGVATFWGLRVIISDDWHFTDALKGYLIMLLIANIVYIIFGIMSAVKARNGKMYYYWIFGKLSYHAVFKINDTSTSETNKPVNTPPTM